MSFTRRSAFIRKLLASLIAVCLIASSAQAAPKSIVQTMTYDVYAGGFQVVSASLVVDLSKNGRYTLRLKANTHGMLAKLAPWRGTFGTDGWHVKKPGDLFRPEEHFSDTHWKDERELTQFFYNKDGSFRSYSLKNEEHKGAEDKPSSLTQGTTDVLSATLAVMDKVAKGGACEGSSDIFDGDRRYALIYKNSGVTNLAKTRLNLYSGPAAECTVEVKPLAGKWHAKPRGWMSIQEQGRERGTMPTVWLANMREGAPAVPVRIRVKTAYGTLFMHITSFSDGQKTLQLKK